MFTGSIVALVTPMDNETGVDFIGLTRLVDFHLANKTDGIVVVGTTGEAATLSQEEQTKIIRHVVDQVAGKIPVIAGTGASSTSVTIEKTLKAMELGVDACLLMTPPYVKPTQEGLYLHFKTVAEKVHIPQILYNVPGRTACDMLADTVVRLSELPNIIGIKEATGKLERAVEIHQRCGHQLDVYSGDDLVAKDIMLNGGKGVISVTANVAPLQMHAMCEAAIAGDKDKADMLNERLIPLHKQLFIESNPIPCKWALAAMDLIGLGIRLPLTKLTKEYQPIVLNALHCAGVLA